MTTLFRSYRRTVGTPGEQDGLERGDITIEYALLPYNGDFPAVESSRLAQELHSPLMTRFTGKIDSGYPEMKGELAPMQSFMEFLSGRMVFSALKPSEDGKGQVLRVWNPSDETVTEKIRLWKKPDAIHYANLAEMAEDMAVATESEIISITAQPRKIVTIRF
jgi:alpha-mannosidase